MGLLLLGGALVDQVIPSLASHWAFKVDAVTQRRLHLPGV